MNDFMVDKKSIVRKRITTALFSLVVYDKLVEVGLKCVGVSLKS